MEPSELDRAKVQIPLAVVDLGEADEFTAEHVAHVDPVLVPADPAVATHAPDLEMGWVLERRQPARVRPGRRPIDRRRGFIRERFGGAGPRCTRGESRRSGLVAGAESRRAAAGGRAVAALSTRCMYSWRPFCSGWAGSMSSG